MKNWTIFILIVMLIGSNLWWTNHTMKISDKWYQMYKEMEERDGLQAAYLKQQLLEAQHLHEPAVCKNFRGRIICHEITDTYTYTTPQGGK